MVKIMNFTAVLAGILSLSACADSDQTSTAPTPLTQQVENKVQHVDAATFAEVIKNGGVILDVQTQEEVAGGHIENASIINYHDPEFEKKAGMIQAEKEVYVYCFSGGRSGAAAEFLFEKGHPKVYNLIGGTRAWKEAGMPLTKPTGEVDQHIQSFTLDAFNEVINSNEKVLVDFHTTWCVPCKQMAPLVDKLKKEYEDQVKILRVDLDKSKEIAKHFNIRAVPTFIFFNSTNEEWRGTGLHSKETLVKVIS
jgi:thioredoxin